MVAEVKIEDGNIVEYDEYGNRMRIYGPNATTLTRIAVDGNWVAAYLEGQNTIMTYHDGMYRGGFNVPFPELANFQMSGNIVILQSTNGQTFEYTNEGTFIKGY